MEELALVEEQVEDGPEPDQHGKAERRLRAEEADHEHRVVDGTDRPRAEEAREEVGREHELERQERRRRERLAEPPDGVGAEEHDRRERRDPAREASVPDAARVVHAHEDGHRLAPEQVGVADHRADEHLAQDGDRGVAAGYAQHPVDAVRDEPPEPREQRRRRTEPRRNRAVRPRLGIEPLVGKRPQEPRRGKAQQKRNDAIARIQLHRRNKRTPEAVLVLFVVVVLVFLSAEHRLSSLFSGKIQYHVILYQNSHPARGHERGKV